MKAILIDDMENVKGIELSPEGFEASDYFIPCACGRDMLVEYTIDGECPTCRSELDIKRLLQERGWAQEHPGYWFKQFENFSVVAGWNEFRFDFYLGNDSEQAYGPDICVELNEWPGRRAEFKERRLFRPHEWDEIKWVYEDLYSRKHCDDSFRHGKWVMEDGTLGSPNGVKIYHESGILPPIEINMEMLFGKDEHTDATDPERAILRVLSAIVLMIVGENID